MKDQVNNFQTKRKYDLEERTARFAEETIDLMKKIPKSAVNNSLIEQCVRAASSIGANYYEATEAESRRDFIHKIGICKKEIKETKYWLRLLARANAAFKEDLRVLWKEVQELLLIFSTILKTTRKNESKF